MVRVFGYTLVILEIVTAIFAMEITPYRESDYKTECFGSYNKLSLMSDSKYHYKRIRDIYAGCTYVHGNLEVTHLQDNNIRYDLDFLSDIEVVTGYVLIALVGNTTVVPLTSLKLIKGERRMKFRGGNYGLLVLGTQVTELQLPALREISRGDVMMMANPDLCFMNTIKWEEVTSYDVTFVGTGASKRRCGECADNCADQRGDRHCWGSGYSMCQSVSRKHCYEDCPGSPKLCHKEGMLGCCHPQCAVGCFGGLDTQCLMCKHFKYGHKCVPNCPKHTYAYAGYCVE